MRKTFKYRLYPTRQQETLPELKNGLRLSKVGTIPIVLHRSVEGKIKICNIPRSSTGKWWGTFSCENISAKRLVQAQWKLELQEKGSAERKKAKKIVAKLHEGMMFKRTGFAHKESAKIVRQYGRIFVEDIHINEMNFHRCLNENIRDVAWSQFFSFLSYKAESAGREFKKINPAYTSQDCSSCGHRQKMPLSDRLYGCPCCGMKKDRDHNAALNILRRGLKSPG